MTCITIDSCRRDFTCGIIATGPAGAKEVRCSPGKELEQFRATLDWLFGPIEIEPTNKE